MVRRHSAEQRLVERSCEAMGTVVQISALARTPREHNEIGLALAEVCHLVQEFGREGWAWGEGALGQFNRRVESGAVVPVPKLLHPLFVRAWRIRGDSGGLFEPRLGALVRLWGFHDVRHQPLAPPSPDAVAAVLAALHRAAPFDGGETYGPAPGVCWDFGAIGKGYAAELVLAWLGHRGFEHVFLNAGGHIATRGRCGERAWRVGIRDPRPLAAADGVLAMLEVRGESVVTHGDDQRHFDYQRRRYSHLLDPRSGEPVRGLRSLTVVHADSVLADAGGAALFAAGPDGWRPLAERLGIDAVLAVTEAGEIEATPALAPRLQLQAHLSQA